MSAPLPVTPRRARRRRPRWRRPVVLGLGVIVIIWLGVSAALLWQARQSIESGIDRLEGARDLLSPDDLVRGEGREVLEQAERDFARARDLARHPVLAPLGFVPLIGQQVRSVEAQTAAAAEVVGVGLDAMSEADAVFATTPGAGPERVAMVEEIGGVALDARTELADVDLGPKSFLIGPVKDAREQFSERLADVRDSLDDSAAAAQGFAQFLQGPSRYLLLAANNAEMRAGSGMWLSAGVLTAANGVTDVSGLVPTSELVLPAGAVVAPPELADRWGFLAPTRDLRNLAATPRFEVTAPLAADMWAAATGDAVDGVMVVDPLLLQALLDAEGPVDVPGFGALDGDNVLPYVFFDQYQGIDAVAPDQQARRDQLGAVARTTLDAFDSRPLEAPALAEELAPAAAGRHVLAWSEDPIEQRGWEAAGVAGDLASDSLLVSLMNTSGTKLDQFVPIDADLAARRRSDGSEVTLTLTVRNDAPIDGPAYVLGPQATTGLPAGAYRGILAVNLPGSATDVDFEGEPALVADGPDGDTYVVAVQLELLRGEQQAVTLHFTIPDDELTIEPSGREPGIDWRFGHDEWIDDRPERVQWS